MWTVDNAKTHTPKDVRDALNGKGAEMPLELELVYSENRDWGGGSNRREHHSITRAKVPGGWLVYSRSQIEDRFLDGRPGSGVGAAASMGVGTGLTFVPDPEHSWNV